MNFLKDNEISHELSSECRHGKSCEMEMMSDISTKNMEIYYFCTIILKCDEKSMQFKIILRKLESSFCET